ncbi:hypothetical protein EV426DRAFT_573693 [Tirmania nivea]|nr:hypothetical protein EV426DRAFT_573693 [Tirmania nivea]
MDLDPKWARIVWDANHIESSCQIATATYRYWAVMYWHWQGGRERGNFNWLMEEPVYQPLRVRQSTGHGITLVNMGKKHHQSKRKLRSRDRSSHHTFQTGIPTINFTMPDHPAGIPPPLLLPSLPLPSPLLPPPPTETSSFNFPLPPSTPPKAPRPVIVRQHGLYTYHNGTPQRQPHGQVRNEFKDFSEMPWPGPFPPPTKKKEVVGGYRYDSEKGISDVDTDAFDRGELKGPRPPPSAQRRRLKCILILTLMIVFFLAVPMAIGAGISIAKKKHNNSSSNVTNLSPGFNVDENGIPTIHTASDSNELSYEAVAWVMVDGWIGFDEVGME